MERRRLLINPQIDSLLPSCKPVPGKKSHFCQSLWFSLPFKLLNRFDPATLRRSVSQTRRSGIWNCHRLLVQLYTEEMSRRVVPNIERLVDPRKTVAKALVELSKPFKQIGSWLTVACLPLAAVN